MCTIHLILSYHVDFPPKILKFLIKYVNNKPSEEYYKKHSSDVRQKSIGTLLRDILTCSL